MARVARVAGVVALVIAGAAFTTARTRTVTVAPPALTDPQIVAILDFANTADIETGSLAAERSTSKDVRDYGTMLSQVHAAVRQKGRDLAA
jgi:putative membrane protein